MKNKLLKALPWIALISGISTILIFIFSAFLYDHENTENKENRLTSQKLLYDFQNTEISEILANSFKFRLDSLLKNPVISTVWLISNDGIIIHTKGFLSASTPINKNVRELATPETKEILSSIKDNLTKEQSLLILSGSAIQREGEHNDIVDFYLVPIKNTKNDLIAFIGVSYNIETNINQKKVTTLLIGFLFLFCFSIYWISLPVWVYLDSRKNDEKYVLWTLFVFIGNLPAYIAYLIIRK